MNQQLIIGGVLVVAAVVVIIIMIARASRPHRSKAVPEATPASEPAQVSSATKTDLDQMLEQAYRQQIESATATFGADLMATSQRLSQQVERLTTEVITKELDEYSQTLEKVRTIAAGAAEQIQGAIAEQRAELEKVMTKAVATEQDRRLAQIDARLADIVSSYLVEALGSGVDLGAQTNYIVERLEQHRDDIRRDLGGS